MGQFGHSEFVGMDKLLETLDGLSEETLLDASCKGLQKTMTRMRDDARRNCPKDTFELQNSIHYTTRRLKSKVVGDLIASSEHAVFVEMGTGPEGEKGLGSANVSPQMRQGVTYSGKGWTYPTGKTDPETGKAGFAYTEGMPPRPYLYPAYKEHERHVATDVRAALVQELKASGVME